MAEVKTEQLLQKLELTALERAWVKASLNLQRKSLQRSIEREIPGSEIERLRKMEIQQVDVLLAKV